VTGRKKKTGKATEKEKRRYQKKKEEGGKGEGRRRALLGGKIFWDQKTKLLMKGPRKEGDWELTRSSYQLRCKGEERQRIA